MATYFVYSTAILRRLDPGDPPGDGAGYAFLSVDGRWVSDPEAGSRIVSGEADRVDSLEEALIAARAAGRPLEFGT